ncbi:LINE-1 retrotransposable element ORF2 protein [Folsomia candida]|uniref:LINE-1 retrotransposable element ORF2 protein n=1 Tax=Folsomia candida TaxID=158441 RepID=A0A226DA57_FOLCA|nr:LINE-1 retrotransposable element ORF2 protein [Folsomia candida]
MPNVEEDASMDLAEGNPADGLENSDLSQGKSFSQAVGSQGQTSAGINSAYGVVLRRIREVPLLDVLKGLSRFVDPKSITYADSLGPANWVIWLKDEASYNILLKADTLIFGDASLKVYAYANPIRRVIVRGVPPFLSDENLVQKLAKYGEIRGQISHENIYGADAQFAHIKSFTRTLNLAIPKGVKVPDTITIKASDTNYKLLVQIGAKKCFKCNKKGHVSSKCTAQPKKNAANENPELPSNGSRIPLPSNSNTVLPSDTGASPLSSGDQFFEARSSTSSLKRRRGVESCEGSGEDVFECDTDGSFSLDKSSSQPRTKRVRAKASKPQKIRQEIFITTKIPQDLEVVLEEVSCTIPSSESALRTKFASLLSQREVTAAPSCDGIYMLGDWNFVVDSNRDRFGNIENRKSLAKLFQTLIQSNGFFDTYRHLRPQGKDVTFVCRMNGTSASVSRSEIFTKFIDNVEAAIRGVGVCSDFPDRKITTVHNGITVGEALCDLPSDQRLKLVWNFFREKFSSPSINLSGLDLFMAQMPKINFPEFLDNALSENEILESITKSPNNKAPGLDGLPYEFYKVFSIQFSKILSLVAKLSCEEGKFPKSCRSSVATLIFKANDPKDLKNYRTISLTNSDYKIISSAIKSRINTTLPSVIGPWQTCGVKGRSIFDNLSFIRDNFQSCELEGLLFSLDQEAAYDRVSHEYRYRVLHNFGYPQKIINYIRLLHTDFSLVISVGSDLTSPISFRVGLKQGDPIASALYCLAIEPFLFNLDNKLRDSGPSAWRRHPNIYLSAYADDTNALLGNQNQISIVVSEYTKFSAFSSSKLNSNKSNILILGAYNLQVPVEFPVVSDGLKILGIYFGRERCDCQMHFLREYLLLAKEIDISHDVVCDSPLEFRGKELSSLPRRSESPCPLEPMGFLSTVTEDKITVHCFIEGMQAPVIQWWQGKNYTDNVLKSQPGISIETVILPRREGQTHRTNYESRLEILGNSSAYKHTWTFWCTAENEEGNAIQKITLSPPKAQARINIYTNRTKIISEEAHPPTLPDRENVSKTEFVQTPL